MCDIEDNFEFDYVDSEYNPYTMPSYAVEPEAIKEIRSKRVPSEIINSAITIFYTLENPNGKTQKVFKKEKRDRRIFVCIYSAYNMVWAAVTNAFDMNWKLQSSYKEG